MQIPSNDLLRQFQLYQGEYEQKALEVLRSGWYVLGREVESFEQEFAAFLGAKHCIGLASGLDALVLALRVLEIGPGDEVIVPANTYIATVMGITLNGATPVFVEPDEFYNIDTTKIEACITEKTKAVLSVNLYGQACNMEQLRHICKERPDGRSLYLIEDCAQSHGAEYAGKKTNFFSDISCFSFYPSKNLGAFGDGGAVVTQSDELDRLFRIYRNYGSEKRYHNQVVGLNSRLDELQAGLLRVKLSHLEELNAQRAELADRYLKEITNPCIKLPRVRENATTVWHLFVAQCADREKLMQYMTQKGVVIIVHYPIPPHLSQAYANLGYHRGDYPATEKYAEEVFTLPLYQGMTREEQSYVIDAINRWEG